MSYEEGDDWEGMSGNNGIIKQIPKGRLSSESIANREVNDDDDANSEEDDQSKNDENRDPTLESDYEFSDCSDDDWRNVVVPHKSKGKPTYYSYSLPEKKQCARLQKQISDFKEFLTLPIVMNR